MFEFLKSKEQTTCDKIRYYTHEVLEYERKTYEASNMLNKLNGQKYFICKDFSKFRKNLAYSMSEFDRCSKLWFFYKDKLILLIPLDVTVNVFVDNKLYDVTHKLIFSPLGSYIGDDYIDIKLVGGNK